MSNQQDTKKKNPNVPTLRFGIGGQKRPLRDVVVFPKSTASCPKNIYISTENLKQDFQGFVAYQDNSLSKGISFKEGDTLFANIRPYLKKAFLASFNGCCSPDVICFRPAGILPGYLYYAIANEHFTDHVMEACKGSKMPRGDRSWMLQKEIFVPSEEEQMKVVSFLRLIDQRIETQNKIINEVSSLINPLFDAYHKNLEAERFSLCDLAVIKKGEQVNADVMSEENEIPMLNGGTSPSGFFTKSNRGSDTITISEGGNSCGYISFMTVPFWAGGHCYTVHPINRQRIHNRYLYFLLKRQETRIMALRVGSGLPNIQKKDLESFSLSVPSLDQQERIAQKLNIVASKLSLEQNLLDSLRHLKQFLLKNMFI